VKERFGAGSKGIGLNLECQEAIAHSRKMMEPVFQPFIQGSEISIDCWMERSGAVKGVVLRRRDEVRNGESRITTTFRDKALESAAVQWFSALKLRGHAVMQVLIDENRQPRIIECNARFGGASTASIAAGLSSLRWSLLASSGQDVTHEAFIRRDGEIRQIRIPTDIHIHDYRF
jgi:carbamoyl-phosphate synthase large subunit